jgi:hypothetical protein
MISDRLRFVFVHIPRTAGTSVETALAPYARGEIDFTAHQNTVLDHKHATAAELRELVGAATWRRYFTFSIVRDPWARMHSDYYFFRDVAPQLRRGFNPMELHLTDMAAVHTFDGWLHACADQLDISQSNYLTDAHGALLVDHVARFEDITEDFARICQRLGVDAALPCANRTRHGDHRHAYTPPGAALVARYAADDIARFGYRFDGPAAHRPIEHRP